MYIHQIMSNESLCYAYQSNNMTVSQLIKSLQEIQKKIGDLPVTISTDMEHFSVKGNSLAIDINMKPLPTVVIYNIKRYTMNSRV